MKKPAGSGSFGMLSVCAGVMRGRVQEQQNTNGVRDLTGLSGFVGFLMLYRTIYCACDSGQEFMLSSESPGRQF